jgi:hypothetical protein
MKEELSQIKESKNELILKIENLKLSLVNEKNQLKIKNLKKELIELEKKLKLLIYNEI